tara:strand:+ start:1020 stop:1373 length:354 start_codon:yes stop_codon:yes gene_type:complete
MAYVQKNNPFPVTGCGRRRSFMTTGSPIKMYGDSPMHMRKTTKGEGRTFRTAEEGAGMTSKGVKQYRKENPGSKLKTAVTGVVKAGSKAWKRRKSFCARSIGWKGERGKAARARWKC